MLGSVCPTTVLLCPGDGAEGQEPLFAPGNRESPQWHPGPPCPCATHLGLEPLCPLCHPPSSEATLSLCHPPGAMATSFRWSGLPKKSVSGCGKQKAGIELALEHLHSQLLLREGQNHGRIVPGQGSGTPRHFRGEPEPNANPAGRASGLGMQMAFKFVGKTKCKARVGFYTQARAGS